MIQAIHTRKPKDGYGATDNLTGEIIDEWAWEEIRFREWDKLPDYAESEDPEELTSGEEDESDVDEEALITEIQDRIAKIDSITKKSAKKIFISNIISDLMNIELSEMTRGLYFSVREKAEAAEMDTSEADIFFNINQ